MSKNWLKSEKGITLLSLTVYIIIMFLVVGIVATVSNFFYGNINVVRDSAKYASEFDKFNSSLISDIKENKHVNTNNDEKTIIFEDGTTYKYNVEDEGLYRGKNKISDKLNLKNVINKDMSYLSNVREIDLVNKASDSLRSAQDNLNAGFPVDVVEIDLKNAWDYLGEIMGMSYKDELVDKIFSNFCLGK